MQKKPQIINDRERCPQLTQKQSKQVRLRWDKDTLCVWQSEILTKEKPDMKFLLMIKDSQT